MTTRADGRAANQLRETRMTPGFLLHAEGSVLIEVGRTRVICSASVEDRVPPFLRNSGKGWVTAEYGMLPRATNTRMQRESSAGKVGGRTQEIQRLIGRSLRSVVAMTELGERTVWVDCDVIQADGGTRTAAITGGWVALHQCVQWMMAREMLKQNPIVDHVAAISCGIFAGQEICDIDYAEDSEAAADANFVLTGSGAIVEIQATAEAGPLAEDAFLSLLALARGGIEKLVAHQRTAIGTGP
jgi:ribonuclease PH